MCRRRDKQISLFEKDNCIISAKINLNSKKKNNNFTSKYNSNNLNFNCYSLEANKYNSL